MTIPTTIPTGGHPADREMTELQKAVIALLGGFSSDILAVANGGTGLASYAAGDLLCATGATTLAKLAKQTNGQLLQLASGLPAWAGDTAWTAVSGGVGFANSWADFGGGNPAAGYFKDASGFVHLRGMVKSGTVAATIFTLPAGYRPSSSFRRFACVSNDVFGYVSVDSSGNVALQAGSNVYVQLDPITFDTR